MKNSATALAHPNIAFIKYWGNRDHQLRIPANGSLSMNLAGLHTRTTVTFDHALTSDEFILNQVPVDGEGLARVIAMLTRVRKLAGMERFARVVSENNFPTGSGIASSASAFAALALAATGAANLALDEKERSILARTGSGSACRSVPGGFVEWYPGSSHETSFAASFAPKEHWNLVDCIAIVSQEHKAVGSTGGHALAATSRLQTARVEDASRRLDICRQAILDRDFETLAEIIELDSNMMHAVMQTSSPPLLYWLPATVEIMASVGKWRRANIPVAYTIDAGPNVHLLCLAEYQKEVTEKLKQIPGVIRVLQAECGGPARQIHPAEK